MYVLWRCTLCDVHVLTLLCSLCLRCVHAKCMYPKLTWYTPTLLIVSTYMDVQHQLHWIGLSSSKRKLSELYAEPVIVIILIHFLSNSAFLPLNDLIKYSSLKFMHKFKHNKLPLSFSEQIEQGDMSPYYVLFVYLALILMCYISLIAICSLDLLTVWRINKHYYYYYYYY